jgi:hypothetical protein
MDENRNHTSHLSLVAPHSGRMAPLSGHGFPLPRRHRRLLAAIGTAATLLLCALSTGTAVQAHRSSAGITTGITTAELRTR